MTTGSYMLPLRNNRLPSLTGMRWLAALGVFLYHVSAENLFSNNSVQKLLSIAFGKLGFVGVSLFFILSGFVISWSMNGNFSVSKFFKKRFWRIYPNHIVTFIATIVLLKYYGPLLPGGKEISGAIPNLMLIHSWFFDPYVFISVNGGTPRTTPDIFVKVCYDWLCFCSVV